MKITTTTTTTTAKKGEGRGAFVCQMLLCTTFVSLNNLAARKGVAVDTK
jgi:hypothetical protein